MQPDKAASMLEKAQVDPGVIRALVLNIRVTTGKRPFSPPDVPTRSSPWIKVPTPHGTRH